jgi:hypothetical protein
VLRKVGNSIAGREGDTESLLEDDEEEEEEEETEEEVESEEKPSTSRGLLGFFSRVFRRR